jgi:predicted hotdog family 3-hydroxylacyl-ACP dehydratase
MTTWPYPIADLLPHSGPMLLLDEVLARDETSLLAAVTVRRDRPFFVDGKGAPAHLAIEWMAQACGACAGANALASGRPVQIGMLLGTRNFVATVAWFRETETVHVSVRQSYNDGEMGAFDCRAENPTSGATLASAQLMVYQPQNASAMLEAQSTGTS